MDQVKEAFQKVKEDIDSLKDEIDYIKSSLNILRKEMLELCEVLSKLSLKINTKNSFIPTTKEPPELLLGTTFNKDIKPTHTLEIKTDQQITPTHNLPLKSLKDQNMAISIRNEGVPTDRQTDRQTDQHIINKEKSSPNSIENASQLLDSLDSIKREIRLKFKRLTDQEFIVFSAVYQYDEEQGFCDYKSLSQKLSLTESSIRDYVGRLIKKGIPIEKKKINNKTIHLLISQNLKKIASLPTILELRDL